NNEETMKHYISTIFTFVLIFSTISSIILIILNKPIGNILFQNIPINPYYFYLIGLSWVDGLFVLPMSLFRAQEKAAKFVFINVLKSFLIMVISVILIVYLGYGAESVLLSHFIISTLITIYTYGSILKVVKLRMNINYLKESLYLSIPLMPHLASTWIISASDRVILEKYIPLSELGIYSLSAQISTVLAIFYSGVNQAMVPRFTRLIKDGKNESAKHLLKNFNRIVVIFGIASIPIAMFATNIIVQGDYKGAIYLLPYLLIGHMIRGFYFVPVAQLFYIKKTKSIASSSMIAATTNIIINLLLIPFIGVHGAILSTIVAELIRYGLIKKHSKTANL